MAAVVISGVISGQNQRDSLLRLPSSLGEPPGHSRCAPALRLRSPGSSGRLRSARPPEDDPDGPRRLGSGSRCSARKRRTYPACALGFKMDPALLFVIVQGRGPEASTGVNRNPGLGRRPDAPVQNHRDAGREPGRRPRAPRPGLATAPTATRPLHVPAPPQHQGRASPASTEGLAGAGSYRWIRAGLTSGRAAPRGRSASGHLDPKGHFLLENHI